MINNIHGDQIHSHKTVLVDASYINALKNKPKKHLNTLNTIKKSKSIDEILENCQQDINLAKSQFNLHNN